MDEFEEMIEETVVVTAPRRFIRLILLGLLLIGGSILAQRFGIADLLQRDKVAMAISQFGVWAPLVFSGLRIVASLLALPAAALTLVTAFLFHPLLALLISTVTTMLASVAAFYIGRLLGRDALQPLLKGRLAELDRDLAEDGIWHMVFLRIFPVFPFNVINYCAGLTGMSLRDYCIGTFIGMMPMTLIYTYLGSAVAEVSVPKMAAALVVLGLLSVASLVFSIKRRRALSEPAVGN